MKRSARRFLLWFEPHRLMVAILFVGLFAMAVREPVDSDTWWHLQAGRVTVESGKVLQTDLFSHTREGSPWVNHSWLSQVMLFWLFDRFSYAGLGLWVAVVVMAAFVFVYLQMDGDPFVRAFIVVLAAATSAVIWGPRPQLLSFLLMAVLAYILYLFKWRGVNRLWLLPPLFALWVNLHAGYALGFMLLVAFVVGEALNHLLARFAPSDDPPVSWRGIGMVVGVSLLSVFALLANPNTTRMWTYYLDTVRVGALQDFIQEWRSPDFHPLYMQPFIWLLLATLAAVGLSGRRIDGTDLVTVALFAYAGLMAGRNLGPFALVAAPVLSRHAAAFLKRAGWLVRRQPASDPRVRMIFGAVNVWLLILICVLAFVRIRTPLTAAANEQVARENFPVDAVDWVRQQTPPGQMFNPYNWGGYLIWTLWPDYQVFVDGRTDLYGDEFLRECLDTQHGRPGFEKTLSKYDVGFIVSYPDDALAQRLACTDGWQQVYRDDVAAVWQRLPDSR